MTEVSDKNKRRSMREMRTAVSARIRSKPTIEGQRYLDLYVLQRDRFRWQRLRNLAERSIQGIEVALRRLGFTSECSDIEQSPPANDKAAPALRARTIDLGLAAKRKRSA